MSGIYLRNIERKTNRDSELELLQEKQSKNTERPPFNDVQSQKFLVHPGTTITNKNYFNRKFWKEVQGILSGKWVRRDISKSA